MTPKHRYLSLDLWRIASVGLLVFSHVTDAVHPLFPAFGFPGFYYVTLGGFAVTWFLILSGLGLHLNHPPGTYRLTGFYRARVRRIYPTYLVALLISIGIFMGLNARTPDLSGPEMVADLAGVNAFIGRWGGYYLETGWFIGLILVLYLLFPVLSFLISRKPLMSLIVLALVSGVSRVILGKYGFLPNRPLEWFPLTRVFEFGLGIYLGVAIPKRCWDIIRLPAPWERRISLFSALTFPLFLIHYPLLQLFPFFRAWGVNLAVSLGIYVTATLAASRLIYEVVKAFDNTRSGLSR